MGKRLFGMATFLSCVLLWMPQLALARTQTETIYLNKGNFVAVDTSTFPAYAFNATSVYSESNARILLERGDTLLLKLINTDALQHEFAVKGINFATVSIAAMDTIDLVIPFSNAGVFIFYDAESYPKYAYLGAASMVVVEDQTPNFQYYWNFHEFEQNWNFALDSGQSVNWGNFDPNYFTVNGHSYPRIELDNSAKIRGGVGDTIHIYLANTGRSVHSVHFHGYHCKVIYSSKAPIEVGWQRDTAPLWPMESLILELVPDKPGIFPVHDHNLMAITANRYYNHGALLFMEIQ